MNWSTAGNWTGGAPTSNTATDLIFAGTTNVGTSGTPLNQNIANPMTLKSITFDATAGGFFLGGNKLVITGSSPFTVTITQSSSNSESIANAIGHTGGNNAVTLALAGSGSGVVTLSGIIDQGSGQRTLGITKSGTSTFVLSGSNSYSDDVAISAGVLNIRNATGLGTTAGGVSVTSGAALELQGGISIGAEALTINGTGISSGGALRSISGANTYAGAITLGSSGVRINSDTSGVALTLTGGITGTGRALTVGGAGDTVLNTNGLNTAAAGTLTKDGTGTLTINAAGNYTGTATISAGMLTIGANSALGTNAAGTTVISGAALGIQGGINYSTTEALTIAGTGISGAGAFNNISGANTFAGAVTMSADSSIGSTSGSLTLSGVISGAFNMTKVGSGTLIVSGANNYTGNTIVSAGTLALGANNAIPDGSGKGDVTVTGTLDLNTFNDTINGLSGAGTVDNVAGGGTPTFTVGSNNASSTFSGVIQNTTGTLGLTKTGTGLLSLSGANTYSGATLISAGTLKLGASNVIPDGSGKGDVTVTGTFDLNTFSETINGISGAGIIDTIAGGTSTLTIGNNNTTSSTSATIQNTAGSLALAKTGTGTLTLSGTNNYGGGTTISQGTVLWNANSALGVGGVTLNDAGTGSNNTSLFRNSAGTLSTNITVANQGSGTATIGNDTGNVSVVYSGTLTLDKDVTLKGGSGASAQARFTNAISGAGGITTSGARVILESTSNSYAGNTNVGSSSVLRLGAANVIPDGSGKGNVAVTGTFDLNTFSETINGLSGAGTVDSVAGGSPTLIVGNNNATSTFSGTIQNTAGNLAITKTGSGALTLSGTNTYSGATAVSAGTLAVNGSTATSTTTVNGTGTLKGTGTVGNLVVDSGGTVAPGNSVGNLKVGSGGSPKNAEFKSGGTYEWEMTSATGAAGTGYDVLTVSGTLTVSSSPGSEFTITMKSGVVGDFDRDVSQSWTVVDGGALSGFAVNKFILDDSDFIDDNPVLNHGYFRLDGSGGDVLIRYSVPEPGSGALLAMGAAGLLRRRQRNAAK